MSLNRKYSQFEMESSSENDAWTWGGIFLVLVLFSVIFLFAVRAQAQSEEKLPPIRIAGAEETSAAPSTRPAASKPTDSSTSADSPALSASVPASSSNGASSESPAAAAEMVIPVETAAFNGIIPGKTSIEELHKAFGKPANVQKNAGGEGIDVEEYSLEGFNGVAFHIMKKTVFAVIAELQKSLNARELATQLEIAHIQSVFLTDEKGTIHGEIFPEIGVAFAYDPKDKLGNASDFEKNPEAIPMNVVQIIFQPVGPEPFLQRAETWVDVDPARSHADILQALKLDPKNEQALAYKKVLEEAVPELVKGKSGESGTSGESVSEESEEIAQNEENVSSMQDAAPEMEPKSEDDETDVTHLDAPMIDSFADDSPSSSSDAGASSEELPENVEEKTEEKESESAVEPAAESAAEPVAEPESGTDTETAAEDGVADLAAEMQRTSETGTKIDSDVEEGSNVLPPSLSSEELDETEPTAESVEREPALEIPESLEDEMETLQEPVNPDVKEESEGQNEESLPLELSFQDDLFEKIEYLARRGNFEQASELLEEVRKKFLDNPMIAFRANIVEGDIQMILPTPDAAHAFQCHRRAAQQADALLEAGKFIGGRKYSLIVGEKQRVKELRMDAWLGIAADIASGPWDKKEENTEKWLQKVMTELTEATKEDAGGADTCTILKYRILYRVTAIEITLKNQEKIVPYADSFLSASMEMLKTVKSAARYYEICTKSASVLDDAASLCMLSGKFDAANRFLQRAISMMELVQTKKKDVSSDETFLLAQLYYHFGQIYALQAEQESEKSDANASLEAHKEAVKWYEKSIPHLMTVIKSKQLRDLLQLGVIVNGMSVSYAEIGNTKRAITLLKTGIFCLEHHADAHPEDKFQLEIPYKNMIELMEFTGDEYEKAQYQRKLEGVRR